MGKNSFPHHDWDALLPRVRFQFMGLHDDLAKAHQLGQTKTLFRPFELYRSPLDQLRVFKAGSSKAAPWRSPHQFGLAVDFVPYVHGLWSWDGPHDWGFLARCAKLRGLECQTPGLEWDKPHVQHPCWHDFKRLLAPDISGALP